ncbi:RNA cytidine acetyltransferase 1-like isoform X2 [Spinacia oleracea]|uniref:RNA cytidine acetyltransferase 1-like isoform X2 n=1 Tax=Spinacia oleracea TaxID=3562 RepID=A0ABM3QJM5_SPIOL|nr:RNA cytidine acetyltransferase 1-like isoform X2 [Spinacia oleracea]
MRGPASRALDEAAAIPLPVVKSLLGPYLVFLSSTVNGYEGTGRSLSLKLVSHLEKQSHNPATGVISGNSGLVFFTWCAQKGQRELEN